MALPVGGDGGRSNCPLGALSFALLPGEQGSLRHFAVCDSPFAEYDISPLLRGALRLRPRAGTSAPVRA